MAGVERIEIVKGAASALYGSNAEGGVVNIITKENVRLILKGAADSYEVPYEETSAYYANLLVGVPTALTVNPTDGDYTNFILSKDEVKGIGFYPLASGGCKCRLGQSNDVTSVNHSYPCLLPTS